MSDEQTPDGWTPEQEALFSRLFRHMQSNRVVFTHPGMPPMTDEHWHTICWNTAWMAAHFMLPDAPYALHEDDDGDIVGAEVQQTDMQ